MVDLGKKIDEYSEEVFVDLGLTALPEERKAEIFARLQDHLHQAILKELNPLIRSSDLANISAALEEENYQTVDRILKRYPLYKQRLESKIEREFQKLKSILGEEQLHAA